MMYAKTIVFFVLITAMLLSAGCRKNVTIHGTWQETSMRQIDQAKDSTTYDLTTYFQSGGAAFTFTVGNTYYSTNSNGLYTKKGNILTLTDTTAGAYRSVGFNVLVLTDQLLEIQSTDTISLSPLTTVQFIYTLSPA